jgi:hypothetical protein
MEKFNNLGGAQETAGECVPGKLKKALEKKQLKSVYIRGIKHLRIRILGTG